MLSLEEKKWIKDHLEADITKLAFKLSKIQGIHHQKIVQQIEQRRKMRIKCPAWAENLSIYFPYGLSSEQSSSQATAMFKSSLIEGSIIDITAGMGMDVWAFSKNKKNKVEAWERNPELIEISTYNHKILQTGVKWCLGDGYEYLLNTDEPYDWVYVDPARRGKEGQKLIQLKDCEPNIVDLVEKRPSFQYLFKLSPVLDIQQAIQELGGVEKIWIVVSKNEVKELLIKKTVNSTTDPEIILIELGPEETQGKVLMIGKKSAEKIEEIRIGEMGKYLYEPSAGILKAGFFKLIQGKNKLKIHPNTHLYTSELVDETFPGKIMEVVYTGKFEKGKVEKIIGNKVEIIERNFPMKPKEIYQKLKLQAGGEYYLFCYRNKDEKLEMSICKRL